MIRTILIDDHPIFRVGLAHYLDGTNTIAVVGQADDGGGGLRIAEEVAWDVAIVDLSLRTLGGLEVVKRLRVRFPERVIVVLSHFPINAFEPRVLQLGAAAYVSKTEPPEELVRVVEMAVRGTLSKPTAERPALPHETLTAREYQVLTILMQGRSTVEVAAELDVSASTVSNHVAQIKTKLGVDSLAGILLYAARVGLLG